MEAARTLEKPAASRAKLRAVMGAAAQKSKLARTHILWCAICQIMCVP